MAWWFLAPLAVAAAKVVYDVVTDDSSSSSSSSSSSTTSNYDEQKRKVEQKAQQEQAKQDKAKRKKDLIQQLSKNANNGLNVIKKSYLALPESIKFNVNNVDNLKAFSQENITEQESAFRALSHLTNNRLALNYALGHSLDSVKIYKEHSELASLEKMLLDELKKA